MIRGLARRIQGLDDEMRIIDAMLSELEPFGVRWSPNSDQPMVDHISRRELIRLIDVDGIQLVDVLPEREFQSGHIPGAVNIPLKTLDGETTQNLSKTKPVAVY